MINLTPFDSLGSPIWKADKRILFTECPVVGLLPLLFPEFSRAEIIRRWKQGALKVANKLVPFDMTWEFGLEDVTVSEGQKLPMVRFQLGKERAAIVLT